MHVYYEYDVYRAYVYDICYMYVVYNINKRVVDFFEK